MWIIIVGITFLIMGIFICALAASMKKGEALVGGIIAVFSGMIIYSGGVYLESVGYPSAFENLPIHGVCEVVAVTPVNNSDNKWITLIQLPNGDFRLFELPEKPAIGLVKVQNDYSLEPFSAPAKPALEIPSAEANSP